MISLGLRRSFHFVCAGFIPTFRKSTPGFDKVHGL
jgi:hypothetical protein